MPEAVSHVVTTYYKLARGETGITNVGTRRITTGNALDWLLGVIEEMSGEAAVGIAYEHDKTTIVIDWTKVPDSIKNPKLPVTRRR